MAVNLLAGGENSAYNRIKRLYTPTSSYTRWADENLVWNFLICMAHNFHKVCFNEEVLGPNEDRFCLVANT